MGTSKTFFVIFVTKKYTDIPTTPQKNLLKYKNKVFGLGYIRPPLAFLLKSATQKIFSFSSLLAHTTKTPASSFRSLLSAGCRCLNLFIVDHINKIKKSLKRKGRC